MSSYNSLGNVLSSTSYYVKLGEQFTLNATFISNKYVEIKNIYNGDVLYYIAQPNNTTSASVTFTFNNDINNIYQPNVTYTFILQTKASELDEFIVQSTIYITIWANSIILSKSIIRLGDSFTLSATFNRNYDAHIRDNLNNIIYLTDNPSENITINSLGNISFYLENSSNYSRGLHTFTLYTKQSNADDWTTTQEIVNLFIWDYTLTSSKLNVEQPEPFVLTAGINPSYNARIISSNNRIIDPTIDPTRSQGPDELIFDITPDNINYPNGTYTFTLQISIDNNWVTTEVSVIVSIWTNTITSSISNVEQGQIFTLTTSFNPILNGRIIDYNNNIIYHSYFDDVTVDIQTSYLNYPSGTYRFTLEIETNENGSFVWVSIDFVDIFVYSVTFTVLNEYNQQSEYIQMENSFSISIAFSPSPPPNHHVRIVRELDTPDTLSIIATQNNLSTTNNIQINTGYNDIIDATGEYILTIQIKQNTVQNTATNWITIGQQIQVSIFSISFTVEEYEVEFIQPIKLNLIIEPDFFIPNLQFRVINNENNELIYWESFSLNNTITDITIQTGIGQPINTIGPYNFILQANPDTITNSINEWKTTGQEQTVYVWRNSFITSSNAITFGQSFIVTATFKPVRYVRIKVDTDTNSYIIYQNQSNNNIASIVFTVQTGVGQIISTIGNYSLQLQTSADNSIWVNQSDSVTMIVSTSIFITIFNETSIYNRSISGFFIAVKESEDKNLNETSIQFPASSQSLTLEFKTTFIDEVIKYEIKLNDRLKINSFDIIDATDLVEESTIILLTGFITPTFNNSTISFKPIRFNLDIIPINQIETTEQQDLLERVSKSVFNLSEGGLSLCEIEYIKNKALAEIINKIKQLRVYSRDTGLTTTNNNNGSLNQAGARYTETFPSANFANNVGINELLLNKKNYMFSNSLNKNVVSGPLFYRRGSSSGLTKAQQFANAARGRTPSGGVARRYGVQYYNGRTLVSIPNIYNQNSNQNSQTINICNL